MHRIDWDEAKNQSNLRKHGISFALASLVFDDPLHVMRQDRIENGEIRWQTLGVVDNYPLMLIAHTYFDDDGQEHIRIISAREATKRERKEYEDDQ